jgi:hypothetical protein
MLKPTDIINEMNTIIDELVGILNSNRLVAVDVERYPIRIWTYGKRIPSTIEVMLENRLRLKFRRDILINNITEITNEDR